MQATVETLSNVERCITVGLAIDAIQKEVHSRLVNLAKKSRVPGFRPGKAPIKVMQQQYGDDVRREAIEHLLQQQTSSVFANLPAEQAPLSDSLVVAQRESTDPAIESYSIHFEVLPVFDAKLIDGAEITRQNAEVTAADIDQMIEKLREQKADWAPSASGKIALKDRVQFSITPKVDGNIIERMVNPTASAIVTPNAMPSIPDLMEKMVGLGTGKATSELPVPASFPVDLQGKTLQVELDVHNIESPILPEVDIEFIKEFGVPTGDLETLKQDLRVTMERELKQTLRNKLKEQVMTKLLESNPIEVPKVFSEREAMHSLFNAFSIPKPKSREEAKQHIQLANQIFGEEAKRRVAISLICAKILEQHEILVNDQLVDERIQLIASSYEDPQAVIDWYKKDLQELETVKTLVQEEQLVDYLLSKAKVSDETTTFEAVMQPK